MQSTKTLINPEEAALLREAKRPVVIFAGAIGDHLLIIPALRALDYLFPGKLEFVCFPRRWHAYYGDIKFAKVYEQGVIWDGEAYNIDTDNLAQNLAGADLVMCFTSWYHESLIQLLKIIQPAHSLGYFSFYETMVPRNFEQNTADLNFDLVNLIDPDLNLTDFGYAPAFSAKHRWRAKQLREELPNGFKMLAVHADTKPEKMWDPENFVEVLNLFLGRHPEYVAVVVGETDLGLQKGKHSDRIFTHFNLPQLTALSLIGEADLFLGVDSCMLHSADLFGIPGVSLFGPVNPIQWGFRFSRYHRDLRGEDGKMENLKPHQVLEALEEVEAESFNLSYQQLGA